MELYPEKRPEHLCRGPKEQKIGCPPCGSWTEWTSTFCSTACQGDEQAKQRRVRFERDCAALDGFAAEDCRGSNEKDDTCDCSATITTVATTTVEWTTVASTSQTATTTMPETIPTLTTTVTTTTPEAVTALNSENELGNQDELTAALPTETGIWEYLYKGTHSTTTFILLFFTRLD